MHQGLGWSRFSISPAGYLALALLVAGIASLALGWPYGAILLSGGLVLSAVGGPWLFLLAATTTIPLAVVGWRDTLFLIDGRQFDGRLAVTFTMAALAAWLTGWSVARSPWPLSRSHIVEWMGTAFVLYICIDGSLRSSSILVWAPVAARWLVYLGLYALARRYANTRSRLVTLAWAVLLSYSLVAVGNLTQFVLGGATMRNEALRATGLGNSGPIAVAFAGELALLIGLWLWLHARRQATGILSGVGAAVGGLAIVSSATRLILVTTYLGAIGLAGLTRRWRVAAVMTAFLLMTLVIRPDLVGRFLSAIPSQPSASASAAASTSGGRSLQPSATPSSVPSPTASPSPTSGDASLRFRFFVWGELLQAWSHEPVLGIGPGMTAATINAAAGIERVPPHNDYIGNLAELGLLGFLMFVALQASLLFRLWSPHVMLSLGLVESLAAAALLLFVSVDVLGALNNPTYFLDIQIGVWAIAGAGAASLDLSQIAD